LALLELVQQKYLNILVGEGRNNFILEWNDEREADAIGIFDSGF
jgi:segregation and condensation protein A